MLKKSSFVNTYIVFQPFPESHSAVVNTGDPTIESLACVVKINIFMNK